VITFRYQELSDDGVPRFPSYVGERLDVELPPAGGTGKKGKAAPAAPAKPAAGKPAKPTTRR
jgi:DNA ligase-1